MEFGRKRGRQVRSSNRGSKRAKEVLLDFFWFNEMGQIIRLLIMPKGVEIYRHEISIGTGGIGKWRPSNAQRHSRQLRQEIPRMDITNNGKYVSVVDNNYHVSNSNLNKLKHGGYFDFRSTWKTADTIYQQLSVNQEAIAIIDNTGLSAIFKFNMPNSDRSVVEACVRRWWDTTHTFHLPTCEIGFTPLDFTMLTCISVGGGKISLLLYFDGDLLSDLIGLINNFFFQFQGVITSGCIRSSQLGEYLKNSSIMDTLDPVTIARVFYFYILGYVFFSNASSSCAIGLLKYLFDMHVVGQYDWGSAILARIYSCLDALYRKKVQSMNYFWQVIEFFFYEYMGIVTPILADLMLDTWFRIHRWIKSNHVDRAKNLVRFNLDVTSQQLEMRSIDSIIWQPYIDTPALGFGMNVISADLSAR